MINAANKRKAGPSRVVKISQFPDSVLAYRSIMNELANKDVGDNAFSMLLLKWGLLSLLAGNPLEPFCSVLAYIPRAAHWHFNRYPLTAWVIISFAHQDMLKCSRWNGGEAKIGRLKMINRMKTATGDLYLVSTAFDSAWVSHKTTMVETIKLNPKMLPTN